MNNEPVVSICCITYKHENYIRECLEGFVTQKTNFPFEVIIHDDASPDKTADIIREYEARYPDIIKPIYQTENQYSKKIKVFWQYVYPKARGKYIAICEGDDFWCDPNKLQMQYDFMESNPDYSLCMHGRYILNYFRKEYVAAPCVKNFPEDSREFAHRVACNEEIYFTQTMFIRKSRFDSKLNDIYRDSVAAPMSDLQIAFHLAFTGKVKYFPQPMAVYRRTAGSATNNARGYSREFDKKADAAIVNMLENSGFAHWIADRRKRCRMVKLRNICKLPLFVLGIILDKLCITPGRLEARKKYNAYIESKKIQ